MKMSNSRGKCRTIQSDGGQLIDLKTKQLLFFECEIETVKQVHLRSNEEFSQEGANTVYEKFYRRRQSKCTLLCLTDRIRLAKRGALGSSPFRKQLMYREIKHFFVFPSNPGIFMLCTVDDKRMRKAYELYRCKPEDVTTISDLTYKASIDPQHVLRESENSRRMSLSPTNPTASQCSDLEEVLDKGSVEDVPVKSTPPSVLSSPGVMSKPGRSVQLVHARSSSVSVLNSNPQQNHTSFAGKRNINQITNSHEEKTPTISIHDLPVIGRDHLVPPSLESPVSQSHLGHMNLPRPTRTERSSRADEQRYQSIGKHVAEQRTGERITIEREFASDNSKMNGNELRNWDDSVTYLQYNPTTGMEVSPDGPIYMYVARFASQYNLSLSASQANT